MDLENIKIEYIKVTATSGSLLDKCIRDSIYLALTEDSTVLLIHNDREFEIEPREVINSINEKEIKK